MTINQVIELSLVLIVLGGFIFLCVHSVIDDIRDIKELNKELKELENKRKGE